MRLAVYALTSMVTSDTVIFSAALRVPVAFCAEGF